MPPRNPKRSAGSSAAAGTRSCWRTSASRPPPISTRSCRDRPVVLERVDGHAVVANSAAMKAAGITAATSDPVGGKIERDATATRPACSSTRRWSWSASKVPPPPPHELDQALAKAQELLLATGITATADMGTSRRRLGRDAPRRRGRAAERPDHGLCRRPRAAGGQSAPNGPTPGCTATGCGMVGVKLYADGALGSRGAWLKQPYADEPDTRGLRFLTATPSCASQADEAAATGFQVADPRDRRRRQCPGHRRLRGAVERKYRQRPPLADRAFPDRRSRRHSAPRAGRHHRLDAAGAPDQRPADGREAARAGPARRRLCLADRCSSRGARSPSARTFRWNRPIRSPASPQRSAGRT